MDVNRILDELKQEHDLLQHTIDSLERLARGQGKRRGPPPAWLKDPATRHGLQSRQNAHKQSRARQGAGPQANAPRLCAVQQAGPGRMFTQN